MAFLFVMALSWLCVDINAQVKKENQWLRESLTETDSIGVPDSDDLTVSLITCYPGSEIYELCGHAAIRVRGEKIDSVWNFGMFDFNQPNFIYRFVKGETDYMCVSYPFSWFMREYVERGSKVVEQDLNLSDPEINKLLDLLRFEALPENATYRYNYVKDNCATRILDRLEESTDEKVIYPDTVRYGTFRNEMRAFHSGYPWYQFGIDLALGSGLDYPLNSREEMFVPVVMMENMGKTYFSDGRPMVKETRILNEGTEDAVLPPTSWWLGPVFWSWVLTLLTFGVVAWDLKRGKITVAYYSVWFFLLGLAGCLISFLVFVSEHEATSPNVLIFWLNPLQFIFCVSALFRKLRSLAMAMAYYNVIASGIIMIVSPFITQSFNPAFYPLILSTFALGLGYAIIVIKTSYKRR